MRQNSYFEDCHEGSMFLIGIIVGVVVTIIILGSIEHNSQPEPTKVCRDGKLYEVTHEGNITIFDRKAFVTCEEMR